MIALPLSRVRLVGWGLPVTVLLSSINVSCREKPQDKHDATSSAFEALVQRGTRVVVERTAGEFLEATVLQEFGEHLRIQTADGALSLRVPRTDVYSLAAPELEANFESFAICGVGRFVWKGCRIVRSEGPNLHVVTLDSEQYRLPPNRVLAATALTKLNIKHAFSKSERRQQFLAALRRAGSPRIPHGWRPGPRERVVAKHRGDWYTAEVHELEEDGARVRWRGASNVDKLDSGSIVPEPPYPGELHRGDFAMMRPRAESEPWVYVRVRAAGKDKVGEYKVEDVKGTVFVVGNTALIPLRNDHILD